MTSPETAPLRHLAIIMDGNRRWAKLHHVQPLKGHLQGYRTFKKIANHCLARGVKILTVYAFSKENWKRSKSEVAYLMKLLKRGIEENVADFMAKGISVRFIGARAPLPCAVLKAMDEAAAKTRHNTKGILNIAINYGGRDEIVRAVQRVAATARDPQRISEEVITKALDADGQPDPDLLIRTSGEQRLSGFLPWQSVYAELHFSPKLWPDFTTDDLDAALADFASRKRRFGAGK